MSSKGWTMIGAALVLIAGVVLVQMGNATGDMLILVAVATLGGAGVAHKGMWGGPQPPKDDSSFGPRGFVKIGTMFAMLAVTGLLLLGFACASAFTAQTGSVRLEPLNDGKGVRVITFGDGEEITRTDIIVLDGAIKLPASLVKCP